MAGTQANNNAGSGDMGALATPRHTHTDALLGSAEETAPKLVHRLKFQQYRDSAMISASFNILFATVSKK